MQRPLWASTSVKDPAFADTMYVVELAAPDTVNTMPEATMHAMADQGVTATQPAVRRRPAVFATWTPGIGYQDVVTVLEDEGVFKQFAASWSVLV